VSKSINAYIVEEYKFKMDTMQLQMEIAIASELRHKKAKLEAIEQFEAAQQAKQHAEELREAATADALQAQQQAQQHELASQNKEHRHEVWASSHSFTMLRTNNPQSKRPYYAIRCKRIDMSGAIRKLRVKHPHSVMVYQSSHVPNPVNLYNRLKSSGVLLFNGNYCSSTEHEADLIAKLGELYSVIE
jgi:Protein of unknown function (DUF3627)